MEPRLGWMPHPFRPFAPPVARFLFVFHLLIFGLPSPPFVSDPSVDAFTSLNVNRLASFLP